MNVFVGPPENKYLANTVETCFNFYVILSEHRLETLDSDDKLNNIITLAIIAIQVFICFMISYQASNFFDIHVFLDEINVEISQYCCTAPFSSYIGSSYIIKTMKQI